MNLLIVIDEATEAEKHYKNFEKLTDNPAFIIGFAFSVHRQGKTESANKLYEEFQAYFSEYFPEVGEFIKQIQAEESAKLSNQIIQNLISTDFMLIQ